VVQVNDDSARDHLAESIEALHVAYRQGQVSPVEIVQEYLRRIEAVDSTLHAYVHVTADLALSRARESERRYAGGESLGLLDGIPFAVKDVYNTRGIPTAAQSRAYAGRLPDHDAAAVRRLANQGAVLLGKLTLTECAAGAASADDRPPAARNPWDLSRSAGASSSGAAVAVAAALCTVALGTDAGGSIRDPASCCGVVGYKPTFGLVSRAGCFPLCWSLDHCGVLSRTVRDCVVLLDALIGVDPDDHTTVSLPPIGMRRNPHSEIIAGLRVGVPADLLARVGPLDPEVEGLFSDALNWFRDQGAQIREIALPFLEHEPGIFATLVSVDTLAFHAYQQVDSALFGRTFSRRLLAGALFSGVEYLQALHARDVLCDEMQRAMEGVDLLALPTRQSPAPSFGSRSQEWATHSLRHPFNVTKQPAVTIPCGFATDALPVGLQLVARCFDDETLLAVASEYERAHDWCKTPPEEGWGQANAVVRGSEGILDGR
jgi:aspartyl-tRNA(Asn)/glutamyl-tRNA(Gln) amidotransferase subunit A